MERREFNKIVKRILSVPTAPFYEQAALAEIRASLGEEGIEYRYDKFGNMAAIVKTGRGPKRPRIAFAAHTDHPGFEITLSKGRYAEANFWGGVKRPYFHKAPVFIQHDQGVRGFVTTTKLVQRHKKKRVGRVKLRLEHEVPVGSFGMWDLLPFARKGKTILTRAADDLGGCATLVALGKTLLLSKKSRETWLIFSRAEENGFNGMLAMLTTDFLPKSMPIITIETSKVLPGAEQGNGPVIRTGDRMNVFSAEVLHFMDASARDLEKNNAAFRWQKKLMDGGICESSPLAINGYKTAGIAYPLVNYHNMQEETAGENPRICEEQLNADDLWFGVLLMNKMVERLPELPKDMARSAENMLQRNKVFFEKLEENRK